MNNSLNYKKTNIDFLCVIRESEGKTTFETTDIPASEDLVSKLDGMVENADATVLDMQPLMELAFPEADRGPYNYVSPYAYTSTYIGWASFPKPFSSEADYDREIADHEARLRESFAKSHEDLLERDPGRYQAELERSVKEGTAAYARNLKKYYLSDARRYINATNYSRTLAEAKRAGDVRMWSTDTIGWSDFTFKVTDNVTICLGTNFGFGGSSYFRLYLRYKGINILPYSHLVRYYYADMCDLIRYTRLYEPEHESWFPALSFVEEVSNLAAQSAEEFVRSWILNEVREMVSRLHTILDNPRSYLQDMASTADGRHDQGFITVRNMEDLVRKCHYGVYPEEMAIALQAEKITGALDFLDNLTKLSAILPEIEASIAEIQDMAVAVIPGLDRMVSEITAKVTELQGLMAAKQEQFSTVRKELEPHEKAIDALYESLGEDKKGWFRSSLESKYAETHKEYAEMKKEAERLFDEIGKINYDISMRSSYRDVLQKCRRRVTAAGLLEEKEAA